MKLEQSFEVAAPLQRVWEALIDVERVAPCLPGAAVTGRNEDGSYNGEFKVKIGPTSAAYSGKLKMDEIDDGAHSATMQAAGTDKRGQGGAKATIVSSVAPAGDGATKVDVSTDYHITGRLARFGRGGMIEEISNRLLGDFSKNLQEMLVAEDDAPAESPAAETPAESSAAESPAADAASEPTDAPAPGEAAAEPPAADPDDAIAGATPVADAVADDAAAAQPPPARPAPPTSGAAQGPVRPSPSSPPAQESEPISAVSLVGSVVWGRVKSNPAPLAALVAGFLVALRVLRRRS